jgi:hypothetical protein
MQIHETAEEVAFASRDPVDAETRRPCGRSRGLRAAAESNLLPRTGLRIRRRTFQPSPTIERLWGERPEAVEVGRMDALCGGGE